MEESKRGKDDDEDDDERAECVKGRSRSATGTLSTSRKNSIEAASFCRV